MSRAYIKCRCGATGYGSAAEMGFDSVEIISMPEEWSGGFKNCKHTEEQVVSIEILSGSEEDQEYESSGL